jgi:plasmid stabilization system protein ParE
MTLPRRKVVRWLDAAIDDLAKIVDAIAIDSPMAAERLEEKIFSKAALLEKLPHLGIPHSRRIRFLVEGNYLVYYTVRRKDVLIKAVVHGSQLFRTQWLRRKGNGRGAR